MNVKKMMIFTLAALLVMSVYAFSYPLQKVMLQGFNTVLNLAKYEGRDAIIIFSDPQCYYCNKLKSETLMDKTVQELLANNFVVGEIYPTQQEATFEGKTYTYRDLFAGFGVKGTPTLVFFTSQGRPITYLPGYMDAKNFSMVLRYVATKQYLKKVNFQEYSKKKNDFLGTPTIVEITSKEADYILNKDPLSTSTEIVPKGDIFLKYVVEGKDATNVAKEMKAKGFYNIFLVKEK